MVCADSVWEDSTDQRRVRAPSLRIFYFRTSYVEVFFYMNMHNISIVLCCGMQMHCLSTNNDIVVSVTSVLLATK